MVEIRVTHAVGSRKRERIAAAGVSTMEINLSSADVLDGDRLDAAILSSAPRHWIYHRHDAAELAKLRDEVEARRRQEAEARFKSSFWAGIMPTGPAQAAKPQPPAGRYDPNPVGYYPGSWEIRARRLVHLAQQTLGDGADAWLDAPYPGTKTSRYMFGARSEQNFRAVAAELRSARSLL